MLSNISTRVRLLSDLWREARAVSLLVFGQVNLIIRNYTLSHWVCLLSTQCKFSLWRVGLAHYVVAEINWVLWRRIIESDVGWESKGTDGTICCCECLNSLSYSMAPLVHLKVHFPHGKWVITKQKVCSHSMHARFFLST